MKKQIKDGMTNFMELLKEDYLNDFLCHEGTFESAFYYYMRNGLALGKNNKIWTQINLKSLENNFVADMGILKYTLPEDWNESDHVENYISKMYAIIEIKFISIAKNTFTKLMDNKKLIDNENILKQVVDIKNDLDKLKNLKLNWTTYDFKKVCKDSDTYLIFWVEPAFKTTEYEAIFWFFKNDKLDKLIKITK